MEVRKEITVNKPVSEVWNVLGGQFSDAHKWARGLDFSQGSGTPKFQGAAHNNRTCEVPGFGTIQEEIIKFDTHNHILAYEVVKGFPGFIASAINTWALQPVGNQTIVSAHMVMQTKGFKGAIMGPMMKMQLKKTLEGVLQDLKIFVETGKVSQQKEKELNKRLRKSA